MKTLSLYIGILLFYISTRRKVTTCNILRERPHSHNFYYTMLLLYIGKLPISPIKDCLNKLQYNGIACSHWEEARHDSERGLSCNAACIG